MLMSSTSPADDRRDHVEPPPPRLAYLDFGLVSRVPLQVREALVCAVALLVFARDVRAVADLFGELMLLPDEARSLPRTFHEPSTNLPPTFHQPTISLPWTP